MDTPLDVLVVGAGPTGLVLALALVKQGARVRVVDAAAEPGTTSRALAVQARTLELYRALGLADDVVRRGLVLGAVNLWNHGERVAHVELGAIGRGSSPYPFGLIFPQDEHERLLIERLSALGVRVERPTELDTFEASDHGVTATLRARGGDVERCEAAYLAGCDGARSRVRALVGAEFPGGTYEHLFYVADVEARGAVMDKELHVMLDDAGFLALFPLAADGRARLIGTVREDAAHRADKLGWDDVDRAPVTRAGLDVARVNWFSTYRVHHRVASRFRAGRAFLLGDAAHIHSPVGGQGMNTGIGDAVNLAWKLAAVTSGRARADVLDTYEPERISFARRLVATTDRVFQAATSDGALARVVRTKLLPRLVGRVTRTALGERLLFRAVSQIGIAYRTSGWSEGRARSVHAGDRLPWVAPSNGGDDDNYTPLAALDWQLHVYGGAPAELVHRCASRGLPIHAFLLDDAAVAAGLRADHAYLVRPDGYLGAVFPLSEAGDRLADYLDRHEIRPRPRAVD
jgi:2-polyprenyl-6-methoxyphenol hydroxylase-like FAD-dependent oxidoreductase